MTADAPIRSPWRIFLVTVRRVVRLSPTFVRITLTGPDLAEFANNGYDQRIKLILPVAGRGLADLPTGADWYAQWRALPDDHRHIVRTYTVRAVRPDVAELDLDIALHGQLGPASSWASAARPGDEVALLGPDSAFPGRHGGIEFRLPATMQAGRVLLAGDETAAPAIMSILECLRPDTRGQALIEVPHPDDRLPVRAPEGIRIRWLARAGQPSGSQLIPEVTGAVTQLRAQPCTAQLPTRRQELVDDNMPWDVPETSTVTGLYVWLAGEAGVIRTLRRHLVVDRGLDRGSIAFMGYWRQGHTEDGG